MKRIAYLIAATVVAACTRYDAPSKLSPAVERELRSLAEAASATETADAWQTVGAIYEREGRWLQAAEAYLRAATAEDSVPADVRGDLARVYLRLGYEGAVVRELRTCLRDAPREPDCLLTFARLVESQGDPGSLREARRLYTTFLDAAPDHPEADLARSTLAQLGGELREDRTASASTSPPEPPDDGAPSPQLNPFGAAISRALAAARDGRPEEAVRGFEEALEIQPDNPGALVGLAEALSSAGKATQSDEVLNRALELAPEDPQVLFVAGALAARTGRTGAVVQHWSRLRSLHPEIAEQLGISERLNAMQRGEDRVAAPAR